jgi:rhamnulokinase
MGVELEKANLSSRVLELDMTNEGGAAGKCLLLKNIMGLWLVQQCKRSFEAQGDKLEYAAMARLASKVVPLRSLVDVNDVTFLNPPDMPRAIQAFCRKTRQRVPKTKGELLRCAYESLALKYRETLDSIQQITGERIEVLHVVGGGSQSALLNQFTADACEVPVIAGPVEATAMGNLLTQVMAHGELKSLAEMREVVRRSTSVQTFTPMPGARWNVGREKFSRLKAR